MKNNWVQSKLLKRKWLLVFLIIGAIFFYFLLPKPLFKEPTSGILLDKNGILLQAKIASDGQWRFPDENEVPEKFAKAIICFEDKRFYHHPGVDPIAFGRAIWLNLKQQKVVSGGSTLSMQTIRISRKKSRTIFEKLIELILAVRLELSYSKKEILSLYANHAPFGGNVVGLQTASWRYFGRDAEKLSWGEAASLAVLPNSPSLVRPDKNRNLLLSKRNKLLDDMQKYGDIDAQTCELAKLEPIPNVPLALPEIAPHLLNSLQNGSIPHPTQTSSIYHSTLNANLQQSVQQILLRHQKKLAANGILNAAALIIDIETNEVIAYNGNVYQPNLPEAESYVDMIPARRSPGSTLKPLLYACMLQDGLMLPHSLVADIPTQIAGYSPQNFDLQYQGAVPASLALARSLNIPAVRQLQQYRYERFYEVLKHLGIKSLNKSPGHYGLSMILGGGENTMWEIGGVYASLARMLNHYGRNNGHYNPTDLCSPLVIKKNEPKETKGNWQDWPTNFVPGAAAMYATFDAMKDLMRPGDEFLWTQFSSSKRIAWKTGTSFGFRDGWAIGVTPGKVVVVWTGNADGEGRPGLTGVSTAAPILFDIYKLLPNEGWFEQPFDDQKKVLTCKKSGALAGTFCEEIDTIYVPKGNQQLQVCAYHQLIHTDVSTHYRVSSDCESISKMKHIHWFVLPPAMEWYYKSHDPNYKSLPPWRSDCEGNNINGAMMEMIYPKKSNAIYVPITIDGKLGKCVFEVAHRNKNTKIFWHLDEVFMGTTQEFHQMGLSPSQGKHHLVLIDENGERIEQYFEVLGR